MPRINDPTLLHPKFRECCRLLEDKLMAANLPIYRFETVRTPFRQAELWATGRTTGEPGKTVTKAHAWESFHQYTIAADYVFRIDGMWKWPPKDDPRWAEFQGYAKHAGLETLSFEAPHVQLPAKLHELQAGKLPDGPGGPWLEWIETQAELWGSTKRTHAGDWHPGAPPINSQRPFLEDIAS